MSAFEIVVIILLVMILAWSILGQITHIVMRAEGIQELNKDCVNFSDGKTAIVSTEPGITGDFKFIWCDGSDVAWFIDKGYSIVSEQSSLGPIDKVYLTR